MAEHPEIGFSAKMLKVVVEVKFPVFRVRIPPVLVSLSITVSPILRLCSNLIEITGTSINLQMCLPSACFPRKEMILPLHSLLME